MEGSSHRLVVYAPARDLAAASRHALDRPLGAAAELLVGVPTDEAVVLGAYQRSSELEAATARAQPRSRRGSGGAETRVGPGTVWMQLSLAEPSALVACEPSRLLNRYVRPLVRAITKLGATAQYGDRDFVSALRGGARAPVAYVAFAHDAQTKRALVEAIVAVSTPFAVRDRASYLGRAPSTLEALGAVGDVDRAANAILAAYADAYEALAIVDAVPACKEAAEIEQEAPWTATEREAIGVVGAGRDRAGALRIGGELMVSRDVLAAAERAVDRATNEHDIDRALDRLASGDVALLGVRSLRSLRACVLAVRAAQ